MTTREEIISALEKRYAVKVFDPSKKVDEKDLKTILESGRLSPSSFGFEPWKFLVVADPELRKKMRAAGYDQTKITDALHLIVVAYRTDADALASELVARTAAAQGKKKEDMADFEKRAAGAIGSKQGDARMSWLKSQAYIPLGVMIETAALLGVDTCPMEGFDPEQINAILNLKEKNLSVAALLAVGYRGNDPYAALPKVRRPYDEVVETI
jgi:nitroreductase/dihydropteridine reductase